jgi:cyclophilin family peptidyl-prolyl cis-trans isomerase
MKCKLFLGLALALAIGCGGVSETKLLKEYKELNKATADDVGKAKDAGDIKNVLTGYTKKRGEIIKKAKSLSKDQLRKFELQFNEASADGVPAIEQALNEAHERLKGKNNPLVVMETSMGTVQIELFEDLAPITVKNILSYVDDKFYDGTIFHRVISNFMIQGGGFGPGMTKEKATKPAIENESYNGLANNRGTLAMARTSEPNSATAQFFINVTDNKFLNRLEAPDGIGYAVFGKVTAGMDVVDAIREVKTDTVKGHQNVPVKDVVIKSIRRVDKK